MASLLVGLLGAVAGFVLAIVLTYLLYLVGAKDALVLVTYLFLFWLILIPGGLVVAILLLRRSRRRAAPVSPNPPS